VTDQPAALEAGKEESGGAEILEAFLAPEIMSLEFVDCGGIKPAKQIRSDQLLAQDFIVV
jgi:hypothetical protein